MMQTFWYGTMVVGTVLICIALSNYSTAHKRLRSSTNVSSRERQLLTLEEKPELARPAMLGRPSSLDRELGSTTHFLHPEDSQLPLSLTSLRKLYFSTQQQRDKHLVEREFELPLWSAIDDELTRQPDLTFEQVRRRILDPMILPLFARGRCLHATATLPTQTGHVILQLQVEFRFESSSVTQAESGASVYNRPSSAEISVHFPHRHSFTSDFSGNRIRRSTTQPFAVFDHLSNATATADHNIAYLAVQVPTEDLSPVEVRYAKGNSQTWSIVHSTPWRRRPSLSEIEPGTIQPFDAHKSVNDPCIHSESEPTSN